MAHVASKQRGRRKAPVALGKPLLANAGIEAWYAAELKREITAMATEYRAAMRACFEVKSVRDYYTEDASATNTFKKTFERLRKKWQDRFNELSQRIAPKFAQKGADYSKFKTNHVLKGLGIVNPNDAKSVEFHNTLQSSIQENVALIKNIQADFANRIEGSVYRSVASANPESFGLPDLVKELMEGEDVSKRRALNIARDQNSKLYTNLNKQKLEANGIDLFRWKHSSAGKTQRHTHIARQKQDVGYGPGIFRMDSPELWEGPKADQGLPGEAINCRCYMIPYFAPELLAEYGD